VGTTNFRIKKADFLSNTIFLPFTKSVFEIKRVRTALLENVSLKEELYSEIIRNNHLQNELNRLSNVSVSSEFGKEGFSVADIIGFTGNFNERNLIINRGDLHRIKRDDPVITSKGIIGKVISTSLNTSVVIPFDHPDFKAAVMDKRSRVQGILENDEYGNLTMSMIRRGEDIGVADTLITSNLSSIFPQGFYVGTVDKLVSEPDKVFIKAIISPFVKLSSLEQVVVLKKDLHKNGENKNQGQIISPRLFETLE